MKSNIRVDESETKIHIPVLTAAVSLLPVKILKKMVLSEVISASGQAARIRKTLDMFRSLGKI